jgi:hypothetical protein
MIAEELSLSLTRVDRVETALAGLAQQRRLPCNYRGLRQKRQRKMKLGN